MTITVNGIELTYELIDGLAIYQGDMILGTPEEVEELLADQGSEQTGLGSQGVGIDRTSRRWPDGVVPYVIDEASYSASELSDLRSVIARAAAHYVENTNIRLVGRTDQRDYIRIRNTSDPLICGSSAIGRRGGRQDLYMACGFGTFVHELNHALGLPHEQSREDRDGFVTIDFANLAATDLRYNFRQDNGLFFDIGGYDYDSIMHYPAFIPSWSVDPSLPLIRPTDPSVALSRLGQRSGLSTGDAQALCSGLYPNVRPRVRISSPADGAVFDVGDEVALGALIEDQLGVQRSTRARWSSDRDGALRNASYPTGVQRISDLTPGTHVLTLETLTDCTNGNASVTITVRGEASLRITSPADGGSVPRGRQNAVLSAEALGFGEAPVVTWSSSLDGPIGSSREPLARNDLSYGEHVLTATATAPGGTTLSDSVTFTVTNDAPSVAIVEPDTGAGFCADESVTFRAAATDLNEVPGFTLPGSAIDWRVEGGASLGSGASVTASFPVGAPTVIARASDSQGATAEASVALSVTECPGEAPEVAITTPATDTGTSDGDYVYDGFDSGRGQWYTDVALVGSASDAEDGPLGGDALVWTTDRSDLQDAQLTTGNGGVVRLYSDECFGVWHEVTLTATDSDGNVRSATRRIFIWTLC